MKIEVITDKVPGCDEEDIAMFVQDALATWGGQRRPEDPLFRSLTVKTVKVAKRKFEFTEDGKYITEI